MAEISEKKLLEIQEDPLAEDKKGKEEDLSSVVDAELPPLQELARQDISQGVEQMLALEKRVRKVRAELKKFFRPSPF